MHFPRPVLNTLFGAPLLHVAWKGSIHFVSNTAHSPTTVIRMSASLSLFLLLPWQARVFYFIFFFFFCSVKMEVNYGTAHVSFSPGLYFNKETQTKKWTSLPKWSETSMLLPVSWSNNLPFTGKKAKWQMALPLQLWFQYRFFWENQITRMCSRNRFVHQIVQCLGGGLTV